MGEKALNTIEYMDRLVEVWFPKSRRKRRF